MALSEIEKLEHRWRENPQGLTFAPLAEAYRKSGDPARALEVLKAGLELHPDYIPASIVLGRCHLDVGDGAAAEAAFTHVLSLDPENVIALKALADECERHQRYDDAERWLRLLLAVDRSNDDARQQLARIEVAREQAATLSTRNGGTELQAPPAEPDAPVGVPAAAEPAEAEPVSSGASPEVAAPSGSGSAGSAEVAPLAWPEPAAAPAGPHVLGELEPTVLDEAAALPADVDPIGGLVPGAFSERDEPPAAAPVEGFQAEEHRLGDLGIEQAEEIELRASDTPLFQVASAADELRDVAHSARGAGEFQPPSAAEELHPAMEPSVEHEPADAIASLLGSAFGDADDAAIDDPGPLAAPAPIELTADAAPADAPTGPWHAAAEPEFPAAPDAVDESSLYHEPAAPVAPLADFAADGPDEPEQPSWNVPTLISHDEFAAPEPETIDRAQPAETVAAASEPATASVDATPSEPRATHPEPALVGDDEPEPVVTETMAELLVRQGHHAAALDVYRELAARAPHNARLQARVAELAAMQPAASSQSDAPAAPTPPAERPRYGAAATGGRSAGDMLGQLLGARPGDVARRGWSEPAPSPAASPSTGADGAAPTEDAPAGAPTRPAPDHLSLSAVFGEEVSPVPPAARAAESAAGKAAKGDGVSFDEFFSGAAPSTAARARAPRGRDDDDLDQFHAWLQNLKK